MTGKPLWLGSFETQEEPALHPRDLFWVNQTTALGLQGKVGLYMFEQELLCKERAAFLISVWHHWVAKGPMLCTRLQQLAVLTASPHADSGSITQVEGGTLGPRDPGVSQDPEVSWDLPFYARCLHFNHWPGLRTAPVHEFQTLDL